MSEKGKPGDQPPTPPPGGQPELTSGAPHNAGARTNPSSGPRRPHRRFRSRTDVFLAIENLLQLGVLGHMDPSAIRVYGALLRDIARLLPEESAAASSAPMQEELRARLLADPTLLDLLSGLLTAEQLEELLREPPTGATA